MLKHILQWLLFCGTFFAAGAPAVGGNSGSAGTGSGAAPTGAGGTDTGAGQSGGGGTPSGGQGSAGAGQGQTGEVGLRQLRETYEGLKAKFEPYEKLNLKPEQISQYSGVYQKVLGEVSTLGRELGYTDQDIAEALAENPVATLDFLRNKAFELQQQNGDPQGGDLQAQMEEMVNQAIGPIQQRENLRMTNEANSLFERTVYQEAVNLFKGQGIDAAQIPQDELQFIVDATSEVMKYEADDVKALKFEGKTAGVQKAFQTAIAALDKYYLARAGREKARLGPVARGGNQPLGPNGNQERKPTLDEIINGDPSAVAAMPSMRH